MGQKALVTIDLFKATEEQRNKFYETLKEENWSKLNDLTTSWKVIFNDTVTRMSAISTIKSDLKKAKSESKIRRVDYAMQLDIIDILNGNITN